MDQANEKRKPVKKTFLAFMTDAKNVYKSFAETTLMILKH